MTRNMSPSEQLAHSTVRIEVETATGLGTGTGFFVNFAQHNGQHVPAIVTNKHVVEGAIKGKFTLTTTAADGGPDYDNHMRYELDEFEARWIMHSEPDVDLCAMPIAPLIMATKRNNQNLFYVPLGIDLIPTDDDLASLSAIEEVIMVGYPNGIWDEKHNMPVFRRGITATHPNLDWNGSPKFLIDAACFPGSSGSPVFLFNMGGYTDRTGNVILGRPRIKLLGVLHAGPQHTVTGEIRVVTAPTANKPISVSSIPNNLGMIIKAKKLVEFDAAFQAMLYMQNANAPT